jgi:excisionase family DNA binding protein
MDRSSDHLAVPEQRGDRAPARRTYSVDEAAVILGISRTTAYQCVKTNELPSLRFRGRIVISAAVIDALLEDPATSRR